MRFVLSDANEMRQPVALGRPRHPGHLHALAVAWSEDDVVEAHVLVETARQIADDRPSWLTPARRRVRHPSG
jgi:hypothetical protein